MASRRWWVAAMLVVGAGWFGPVFGQTETIEKIVVDGNVRISTQALMSQLSIKEGEAYDEDALRREFKRLWDLNLFDNITLEVRQGEKGKILLWHVTDKPLVADVDYKDVKAFTATQLEEKLADQKADIKRGSPLDYTRIRRAQETIEMLLGQKGFLDAEVKVDIKEVSPGQEAVTFKAHQGGKTKIQRIYFKGNTVFKTKELKKMMKLTREHGLFSWAGSKDLYHPGKFDEDARNIRQAYMDRGYLDVDVKPEVVEVLPGEKPPKNAQEAEKRQRKKEKQEAEAAAAAQKEAEKQARKKAKQEEEAKQREAEGKPPKEEKKPKEAKSHEPRSPKKWIYVTVPIEEGPQYRVGTVSSEGNKVFNDAEILSRVHLQAGDVFNDSFVKNGLGRIQLDYGERGYFYVTANQVVDKEPRHVANLKIEINEDRQYRINTLEFAGNTTTRDKVLRREMRLAEEDLFDLKRFRVGMRKINQLGYWQISDEATIRPRTGEDKVDITVHGKESNRNEIQVGGGVSGLDGAFFSGSYATRNFLGRGEILQTYFQLGGRLSRYSISFIEPWFLARPYTVGFSIFKRTTDYLNFQQGGQGLSIQAGRLLGDFSRIDMTYLLENVTYTDSLNRSSQSVTSSIIPVYTYDTRNNFFRPTRGLRLQLATEYAGGSLGGDNFYWKPYGSLTFYLPAYHKHYIGVNAAAGYVGSFEGRVVPAFERFFLGGERSLRAFKSRTISPARSDVDLNHNGIIDRPEDRDGDGILDGNEDLNGNGILDCEDLNHNGVLDPGEDVNGNGVLDCEDVDHDGHLDFNEDLNGNGVLDKGEDTNGDGVFGTVFPGGNKFVQFNFEYIVPIGDTFEFLPFLDTGNAFDDYQKIDLTRLRVDYGLELRFYLPVFQAPLRFIYGFIQDPRPGEKASSFQFSIGTTF
jgi:outer membrane protein insertion porin family